MKSLVLFFCLVFSTQAFADVLLKDVGVIGLASHDMFSWDRENEVNKENGRLDLSTIFDYENGKRWKKGGDPKNGENAPVWTVTKNLVKFYKAKLKSFKKDPEKEKKARIVTVKKFHQMIVSSFERLSGLSFPTKAVDQKVNNVEQAAMRALHDILPGRVKTHRSFLNPIRSFKLTNFLFAKFYLNKKEMDQKIAYFNGDYDQEYKEIKIPFTKKIINLKEVDGRFIEKFSPYKHDEMLEELRQVGQGDLAISEVSFIHHIKELFQKGMCSKNNQWVQTPIPCE